MKIETVDPLLCECGEAKYQVSHQYRVGDDHKCYITVHSSDFKTDKCISHDFDCHQIL